MTVQNFEELKAKNTPKPLLRESHPVGDYKCPVCKAGFYEGAGRFNYCGNCGQKLDWSKNE